MKGIAPEHLRELFIPVNREHEYNLRCLDVNVKIPLAYSEYLKRSLSYSGATFWNRLPYPIRNLENVRSFNKVINIYNS